LVQTFFERSFAINRLRQGPLAGHIDLLAAQLATHGYSRVHSRIQLRLVGHFNRWLEQKNLTVRKIDEQIIERYWRYFMRKKRVRSKDVSALMKLLDLLREQGVTPRRIEAAPTARETLLEKYRCYLREERGLAYGSVRNMMPFVDRFLAQKYPRDHFDFAALKAGDITSFVRKQATELGGYRRNIWFRRSGTFSDTCGIPARSTQISLAAFLAYRFIRFPRFRNFCHLVPLRQFCSGPLELRTDGATTRS
jgi:hypothetical protein